MKKWKGRALSIALACSMVLGLTACGGDDSAAQAAANAAAAKEYVYKGQDLDLTGIVESDMNVMSSMYLNEKIYILAEQSYWEEVQGSIISLISVNPDGSNVNTIVLQDNTRPNPNYSEDYGVMPLTLEEDIAVPEDEPVDEEIIIEDEITDEPTEDVPADDGFEYTEEGYRIYENGWFNSTEMNESGVYLTYEKNAYYMDDMGNYVDMGGSVELLRYDLSGNDLGTIVVNDNQSEEYIYINNMAISKSGHIALNLGENLCVYGTDGAIMKEIPIDSTEYWLQQIFFDREDRLCILKVNSDYTKMVMDRMDMNSGKMEEGMEIPFNMENFYQIRAGKNYDVFMTNQQGAYGYNFGDTEVKQVLSYINSDINSDNVNRIEEVDAERLLMLSYNYDDETGMGSNILTILTHVKPEDIVDRKVITYGCYYLDYNARQRIVDFNKTNEEYRIAVKDYSIYSQMDDWTAGYTQLNNDILAGQMPDILVVDDDNIPLNTYIDKGLLEDIKPMIENDPDLNYEDYMTNVFDAYSVDGKLYQIIPSYYVSTVVGKTSLVGNEPGWTMEEFNALLAKYPEANAFGSTMARRDIIYMIMMYSSNQFIDYSNGKCDFDNEEFAKILEFVKSFPAEINYEDFDDAYWMEQNGAYRANKSLLMSTSISDVESYICNIKGSFGEEVTMIGFPSSEGIGAVVDVGTSYAISSKSAHKEGAWNFLKYYLTTEYQEQLTWQLPTIKAETVKRIEKGMERPYWEDQDGNKEYYDYTYWTGDTEIILDPLTRAEVDELVNYISTVNQASRYDDEIINIIQEEADAYFTGQKDVRDVTNIIQSRIQIYLSEGM